MNKYVGFLLFLFLFVICPVNTFAIYYEGDGEVYENPKDEVRILILPDSKTSEEEKRLHEDFDPSTTTSYDEPDSSIILKDGTNEVDVPNQEPGIDNDFRITSDGGVLTTTATGEDALFYTQESASIKKSNLSNVIFIGFISLLIGSITTYFVKFRKRYNN